MKKVSTWVLASLFFVLGFSLVYAQMGDTAASGGTVQEAVGVEAMNATMNEMGNMVGNMMNEAMGNAEEKAEGYLDEAEENMETSGGAAGSMDAAK